MHESEVEAATDSAASTNEKLSQSQEFNQYGRLILALASLFAVLWTFLFFSVSTESVQPSRLQSLPASAAVKWPESIKPAFPKQGPDQCGAFSLALGLRLCEAAELEGSAIAKKVTIETPITALSGTLPWRVVNIAREHKLATTAFSLQFFDSDQRLNVLKSHLAEQRPVIVLIESVRGTQHYIVCLGFADGKIDIYDPNLTAQQEKPEFTEDQNGARPGNLSVPEDQFFELWERGGIIGLYRWWYLPLNRRI